MKLKIEQEKAWAGTESSLKAALDASEAASARMAAGEYPEDQNEDKPRLLEVSDEGVAVVQIKGPLNNDQGFWNEIFGMTGYPEIRDALIHAANDQSVKSIMLDIDSGGGAVSGVADTAQLIRMINDKVKPVVAFTDGMMASAAYWLGAAAGKVHAGKTAVVGSIGVLSTHKEYSQALKDRGVGVTVVRAGKYKALANSVEKLTDEGKQQIQQVVDAAYTVFVEHVASMRGQTFDYTDQHMAQGREFVGEAAVNAGLVDSISTFDAVFGQLKENAIDSSKSFMENRVKPNSPFVGESGVQLSGEHDMKKALTAQDIAAIAAGAPVAAPAAADTATPAVDATALAEAQATVTVEEGAEEPAPAASATAENPDNSASAVQLLTAQLKEKDESLIQAHVTISQMRAELDKMSATHGPLVKIAASAVNNLRVAMNGTALNMEAADPAQLLAEHASLTEQFTQKFKVGGVAAVSADQPLKTGAVASDALTQARLAAVRPTRKGA